MTWQVLRNRSSSTVSSVHNSFHVTHCRTASGLPRTTAVSGRLLCRIVLDITQEGLSSRCYLSGIVPESYLTRPTTRSAIYPMIETDHLASRQPRKPRHDLLDTLSEPNCQVELLSELYKTRAFWCSRIQTASHIQHTQDLTFDTDRSQVVFDRTTRLLALDTITWNFQRRCSVRFTPFFRFLQVMQA